MNAQPYMNGKENKLIVDSLQRALADTFVLYYKTHSFHWNVTGPQFRALHEMFEEQYTDLWQATDEIAERIRQLDAWAPVSWQEMIKNASLSEAGQMPDAGAMVEALAKDNRAIVDTLLPALQTAQESGDEATADILIGRVKIHEKAAWMLESMK